MSARIQILGLPESRETDGMIASFRSNRPILAFGLPWLIQFFASDAGDAKGKFTFDFTLTLAESAAKNKAVQR
jgi:hypothetical protein